MRECVRVLYVCRWPCSRAQFHAWLLPSYCGHGRRLSG